MHRTSKTLFYVMQISRYLSDDIEANLIFQDYKFRNFESERDKS
jgi:ABC-type iron transport system FetAB ATPase subunit